MIEAAGQGLEPRLPDPEIASDPSAGLGWTGFPALLSGFCALPRLVVSAGFGCVDPPPQPPTSSVTAASHDLMLTVRLQRWDAVTIRLTGLSRGCRRDYCATMAIERDTCPTCGAHVPSPGTSGSISMGTPAGSEETWQHAVCAECGTALRRRLGDANWMIAPQQPEQ